MCKALKTKVRTEWTCSQGLQSRLRQAVNGSFQYPVTRAELEMFTEHCGNPGLRIQCILEKDGRCCGGWGSMGEASQRPKITLIKTSMQGE